MPIAQLKMDASAGEIVLRLQADSGRLIQGVLSSKDVGHLDPHDTGDPSVVEWLLPASSALYVIYGVVLPQQNLLFAPGYTRTLLQGGASFSGGVQNPRRVSTTKHADGEWVGPPEAFRILIQGA